MKNKIFLIALLFLAISFSKLRAESDTLWSTQIGSTVRTVKFSPDGQYVYAAAIDRGIIKINAQNGDIIQEFEGFKYSDFLFNNAVDVSPDGKMIVGGDFHKLYLYNNEDRKIIDSLESNTMNYSYNRFNDVLFTKDNKYIIACLDYAQTPQNTSSKLLIWDINSKKIIKEILGNKILKMTQSETTSKLAFIDRDNSDESFFINLFEIGTWKEIGVLKGHTSRITDLSFSPDGSLLASCDDNAFVKIWNIDMKELEVDFKFEGVQMDALNIFQNDKIALGGGSFDDWKFKSKHVAKNLDYHTMNLRVKDIDYQESKGFIIAENKNILLIKADRLTSVSSDFTKDLIYPNPATNLLTIPKTFFENNFISLSISDITGKTFYSNENIQNEDLIIDVSNYPKGTYYINYNYKSGSQSTRFVKE